MADQARVDESRMPENWQTASRSFDAVAEALSLEREVIEGALPGKTPDSTRTVHQQELQPK